MSLQSQIALGKNMSLQRQLDGKYVEFKRAFRSSRRRLDSFEEECVSSLYKLLLEAKANKMDSEISSRRSATPDIVRGRSKSVPLIKRTQTEATTPRKTIDPTPERPYTSMSSRTYTQSYSFKKDGLDISKYTRGGVINKQSTEEPKRPLSVIGINPFSEKENRSQQTNVPCPTRRTPSQETHYDEIAETFSGEYKSDQVPNSKPNERIRPATSILKNRKGDQILVKVHESNTKLDEFRPLSVTITHTTPLEHPIYSVDQADSAFSPRPDTAFEEELLPLIADNENPDIKTKGSLSSGTPKGTRGKGFPIRNNMTKFRKFRTPSRTESEDSDIARTRSIQNQQKFLADYSRRSKLFGYVVKTKSASISQDKSRRISRSPCVTYQELVGIKSGMRQQESQTRMLLKRSAKLSTYVDQLAMASQYRQHIQALKSGNTPES